MFRKPLTVGILVLWAAFAGDLQAQSSKIEFDLFGLGAFPLQEVQNYSYHFDVYQRSWDSHQEVYFKNHSLRLGFGAGITYWINDSFGLRVQAVSWKKQQVASDNDVFVTYSYLPWYPYFSDQPVEVAYNLKSNVQPELTYRVSAFSLSGVLRKKIGPFVLESFGGLTAYQVGGELQDLYLKRTIPMSHMTFFSHEVVFSSRFDFMSLGGNLGLDLAVPMGGHFEGFLGLKYFFGGSGEPEMFVQSMNPLDGELLSLVIPGIDDIKDHVRYGALKLSPSSLSLGLGLRYRPPSLGFPPGERGKFRFMLGLGASKMNPEMIYERTMLVTDDGSNQLSQNVDLFNKKLIISYGGGVGYDFSPHWAFELLYQHQPEGLDADAGPVILMEDDVPKTIAKYQRPQGWVRLDELAFSLVRSFPIPGARVLVSAGMNLARLSLSLEDLYFLYWYGPWSNDFVSFSGLYTTTGSSWLLGARAALGIQFPIAGLLEGRLMGSYNLYREASIPLVVKDYELDRDVYGPGDTTALTPEQLKQAPTELLINPSRLRLAFDLVIRF